MKRKLAWSAAALVPLFVPVWLFWPSEPEYAAVYEKIQLGMTLGEVEDLIGMHAVDIDAMCDILFKKRRIKWVPPDTIRHDGNDWSKARPDASKIMCWGGARTGIAVQLGDDGCVIGKHFEEGPPLSFFDNMRFRLGLPWW